MAKMIQSRMNDQRLSRELEVCLCGIKMEIVRNGESLFWITKPSLTVVMATMNVNYSPTVACFFCETKCTFRLSTSIDHHL